MNRGFSPQALDGLRKERKQKRRQKQVIWGILILCVIVYILAVYVIAANASPDCPDGGDCHPPRPTPTATIVIDPLPYRLWLPIIETHRGWLPFDLESNGRK